ncbi:tetratricopeptide repeat protein [Shewanella algae]|uniref:YfgM family protein n=1 Tax=Shewanella algae TaxID=38313 RepID=UPI0031F4854A
MEIYSTEEQQVEAIKQFWKDYGTSIVAGVVIGLGGLYGWNYYSDVKVERAEAASQAFNQALMQSGDEAAVMAAAAEFDKQHAQAGYSALMQLIVAKSAVESGDLPKAEAALKTVIAAKPGDALTAVATLRLARIQAEQGQVATALATLDQVKNSAFSTQRDEFKGDLLLRQGETDKARLAYQEAVKNGGVTTSPALQMKLDNLNQA